MASLLRQTDAWPIGNIHIGLSLLDIAHGDPRILVQGIACEIHKCHSQNKRSEDAACMATATTLDEHGWLANQPLGHWMNISCKCKCNLFYYWKT
jgi:hypothetical protein